MVRVEKHCERPTPEIEITPEMLDAGENELLCELGGAVSCHWLPRDLAEKVYRAMQRARLGIHPEP